MKSYRAYKILGLLGFSTTVFSCCTTFDLNCNHKSDTIPNDSLKVDTSVVALYGIRPVAFHTKSNAEIVDRESINTEETIHQLTKNDK